MQENKLHKENAMEENTEQDTPETTEWQDAEMESGKDTSAGESAVEQLAELLAAKTAECETLLNRHQRLQADFENYKKRSRKELEDMAKYGMERLVTCLLPVLDNFARALEAAPGEGEVGKYMSGMDLIYRQCQDVLAGEGLKIIEAVGQPFDPERHHAVMQVETDNTEEDNLVIEELQVGYSLLGKVIRPSMVKVAKWAAG